MNTLRKVPIGGSARVVKLHGEGAIRRRIMDMGITKGVEIRVRQLGRRLDLCRVHPHKFRRTLATRAIDKGMPVEQVQRLLGHSKIETTMEYAMVDQSNVRNSHRRYLS